MFDARFVVFRSEGGESSAFRKTLVSYGRDTTCVFDDPIRNACCAASCFENVFVVLCPDKDADELKYLVYGISLVPSGRILVPAPAIRATVTRSRVVKSHVFAVLRSTRTTSTNTSLLYICNVHTRAHAV